MPAAVEERQQPSLTWKLDFENKRITQMIDGLEAVKQAAFVILETERFRYLIYSFNFGSELQGLIGKSPLLVRSEIQRLVREALLQDDRITDVRDLPGWQGSDDRRCGCAKLHPLREGQNRRCSGV